MTLNPTISSPNDVARDHARAAERESYELRVRMLERHVDSLTQYLDTIFDRAERGEACGLRYPDGTVIIIGPLTPTEATE